MSFRINPLHILLSSFLDEIFMRNGNEIYDKTGSVAVRIDEYWKGNSDVIWEKPRVEQESSVKRQ